MSDSSPAQPLRVTVDLTPLLRGGQNGGVKPFIFEYLGWLGRQQRHPIRFTFLTRRLTHGEVRTLARSQDELICVLDDPEGAVVRSPNHSPQESTCFDPPGDLLAKIGTDVLYLPFGYFRYHSPGIPTLATVVDVLHRDYPHTLSPENVAQRERIFREIVDRADFIQGISAFTLDRVSWHYAFPRERMFCSYIAIHDRLKSHPPSTEPSESTHLFFLYPANAWEHKNHRVLLLAYGIYLQQAGPAAWDLILTGHDDAAMRGVIKLSDTLGLAGRVRFMGHLPDADFTRLWRDAGAVVFPSLYEGFGIPLVEAMAFGLPLIASQAGALPEIGGDACLYVDALKPVELAGALALMSRDTALRADLRLKGFARLAQFSFEKDAQLFLEKLLTCASTPARSFNQGLHPDGWTDPTAVFPLPAWNRPARLEIKVSPMPAARTLLVSHAGFPAGTFHIPVGTARGIDLPVMADGRMVSLLVSDASHLSSTDHRCHGILLQSLALRAADGQSIDLLQPVT